MVSCHQKQNYFSLQHIWYTHWLKQIREHRGGTWIQCDDFPSQLHCLNQSYQYIEGSSCLTTASFFNMRIPITYSEMKPSHSHLQSFARPPPRIAKGDEQVIQHIDRQPYILDSVTTSREKTILFNRLAIVSNSWSGVSREKYTFNYSTLTFQRV